MGAHAVKAFCAALLLTSACGEEEEPPRARASLIDHNLWERATAEEDPFADRPDSVDCPDDATEVEDFGGELTLSVDTQNCDYVTVRQPALSDIQPNESIQVRLWHFELSAVEPAEAHVAIRIGDAVVMDEHVPIPSDSELLSAEVLDLPSAIDTPIWFHLHNHGINSYALIEISRGTPSTSPEM